MMRMQRRLRAAAAILLAAAILQVSAGLRSQDLLFTSRIDLVQVGVTVLGRDGEPLSVLTRENFEVYEDGKLQDIRYFARGLADDSEIVPTHLGVLFDASGSMERDVRFAKTAAIKFLNTLTYAEDMTVVDFDTEIRVARYDRNDFPRLVERLRSTRTSGQTALYDALGVYLDGAFEQDGRKVLLLYTDGADTVSRTSRSEVQDFVKASDVTIYAIGFQEQLPSSVRPLERMRLQQLTALTGGRSYFPGRVEDLDEIYEQIAAELDARYSLGYVSTNSNMDGSWRELEVKLRDPPSGHGRLRVRTREGYFAPYRDSSP